jgi:Uma2 family endonuclease
MSVALRKSMSLAEFLAWEESQEIRFEFDGHGPVAMIGGTVAHSTIQHNLHVAMGVRLRGKPCRFHGSDLKIEVAGSIRYPNGLVVCSPNDGASTVAREPVVIFEILSDSTARTDLFIKNREYAATPSVRRYVLLSQHEISATIFERVDGDWVGHLLGLDSVLTMPEIEVELPLAELYEGVALGDSAAEA